MENPILYRFTGTKPLQWFATMEAYFRYTEERSMNFSGWGGEERKVWFACKYLDIGDLDRFFQWMEGVTKKIDWEAFKACVVYQFGTFEENCEFDGYEVDYGTEEHEPIQVIEEQESIKVIEEQESIQVIEVHESIQVEEEELIKNNQGNDENELLHQERVLEEESIPEEEEVYEKIILIQDNDSKSMESLVMSVASQVSFSQLEPNLQCYNESMDVCEQHSSLAWDMLFESELGTTARLLGIELSTQFQVFKEKEYAHHLFDEMTVKKQMLHEKEIRSLFSKCWKFKFKNLLCFPIDQVIQCGVLPHLVEFLKKEDFPKLLFEAITAPFAVILSGLGLNQAATNFYSFDQGRMAAYSLFEMITRSSSVANQGAVLASVQGNIEFRNVYFINADYIAVMEEGQLDEMGTHDELINLGGLYAELLKCEEETKFPRRCGALKPLSVQRDSEPSVIALLAVGIKQRMQQPKRKRNSLFPKNWKFKFKNRDLEREKQGWKQSDGAKCELNFQLEWLFFYGSLPRPPEHCKRKI